MVPSDQSGLNAILTEAATSTGRPSDPTPGPDDVAEPATELTPDIPVARVFMPVIDNTGVPWCTDHCPHHRAARDDRDLARCAILDDEPERICEPAVRAMASATRGLAGATWEQGPTGRDELRLRDGTLLIPNGGSGGGSRYVPSHAAGLQLPPDHELGGPGDAAEPTATRGSYDEWDATHGDTEAFGGSDYTEGDGDSPPDAETRRGGPPLGWVTLDRPPVGCEGLYHQELRITLTISEAGRLGWSRVDRVLNGADVALDARVYLVRRWLESTRNRCICPGEATRDCPVHGWDE